MSEVQKIHITAEPQSIPTNCLFRVDRTLLDGLLYVSDPEWAKEWAPLAAHLFEQVEGVRGVRIHGSEVLVTMTNTPEDWRVPARSSGAAIRTFLEQDGVAVKGGASDALEGDDLLRHKAQKVVDDTLNPGLASHGGFVEIMASEGRNLYISMGGGCQGCGSAAMTMKQGVEVAIRSEVPEIEGIFDSTDHAAGSNPFM
jgi:Fe-S cluster biogenesis protein NfuA